ncbi:MAG: outer membrane beta-barrel protein [Holophaga sp.]|nr:outer membrane beta-barrel protein [Holophaga sp.]
MEFSQITGALAGVLFILVGAPALKGQSVSCGGQVTLASPLGDLGAGDHLDHRLGGGGGLHLAIALPGGHIILPRVDYTAFQDSGHGDARVRMFQAGADYDFFLGRKANEGVYVGVGLGYGSCRFQLNTPAGRLDDTPNNVYCAAQVGCMFTRHLGVELRYLQAEYKPGSDGGGWATIDSPTLNASLIVRY